MLNTDTLQFSFNGGPLMSFAMAGGETTAANVASTLNLNPAFNANAVAGTTLSGALTITSLNDTSGSTITVGGTNAATVLGLSGTTTVSPSTGKSLGESVTATLGVTGTASVAGTIVRIQGGGLAGPVDITLAAADTSQALGVADLLNQANNNQHLRAVGITISSANGQLIFASSSGQNFNVSAVGDTTNSLGLGNYLTSGAFFDYSSITGATATVTGAFTDQLEISVAGSTPQQVSVTGAAADTTTSLVGLLNTALASNKYLGEAGIHASVSGTHITLSSTNGTAFRVAEGTGTLANQILGFAAGASTNTLTAGAVNYAGGDAGSFAAVSTSSTNDIYFAAGGSAATSVFSFNPILNGQDDQTVTVNANDSSGTAHSIAVVLSNNATARNARSLDEAITAINTQLQQSNDPTLSRIVAVKNAIVNANGVVAGEGVQFVSALPSFSVTLGAAGSSGPVGIGSATDQGTVQSSTQLAGGGSADISNQSSAESAVTALASAVSALGAAQAVVGRGENQFTYAVNLAQSQLTNLAAAESSIRDADMAAAAANLTKAQILVQAGVAALAQANSAPQQVLKLLQQ
jgi:flagellin